MVAKMFYVLLHTLNSFLSALSIGEMAFGFEFELHAYMTFATTYYILMVKCIYY